MSPLLSPGRMRLLGFGVLIVTFLVGALAGAAVDRVVTADPPERAEGRRGEDGDRRRYVIDDVDLTDAQRTTIDGILERRADRMRLVWDEVSPRMEAITDSARADIMAVLTPGQRADYEARLEARRKARRDRDRDHDSDEARRRDGVTDR